MQAIPLRTKTRESEEQVEKFRAYIKNNHDIALPKKATPLRMYEQMNISKIIVNDDDTENRLNLNLITDIEPEESVDEKTAIIDEEISKVFWKIIE